MKFDNQKVSQAVAEFNKKGLSGNELAAVGAMLQKLGEAQKEQDYLDEYLQATINNDLMGGGGGTLN